MRRHTGIQSRRAGAAPTWLYGTDGAHLETCFVSAAPSHRYGSHLCEMLLEEIVMKRLEAVIKCKRDNERRSADSDSQLVLDSMTGTA